MRGACKILQCRLSEEKAEECSPPFTIDFILILKNAAGLAHTIPRVFLAWFLTMLGAWCIVRGASFNTDVLTKMKQTTSGALTL